METTHWWQASVIYQIYPRSFQDSNGDGVGDLKGIAARLDYLSWLGVDALWLSPIYPSPMADFGYDVADYTDIDPLFGTLADFDALLAGTHRRGLKLLLDFVPNHSSDEHAWFIESRSSRTNRKRDWYIWRDAQPDGSPPNNWLSFFGGSAWTWDEPTGQYYLHLFDTKQPDLNWRNPAVRQAMHDVLRFWFERGVDGFRIDVLWLLAKDEQFRDDPPNPAWREGDRPWTRQLRTYSEDLPEVHEYVRELRMVAEEYGGDRLLIGEIYLPIDRLVTYHGTALDEVHLPFNFGLAILPEWEVEVIARLVAEYEAALPAGAWPNWVLGNHDLARIATRVGPAQARLAAMLLLTLRGTPTIYYGDELGMEDVPIPPALMHDPQAALNPSFSRDPARSPMQWDATPHAGFCPSDVAPWLPVAANYREVNVATQRGDECSILNLHERLLSLRRSSPALTLGDHEPTEAPTECFAYVRVHQDERMLVALNFGESEREVRLPGTSTGLLRLSTRLDRSEEECRDFVRLRRLEGCLVRLDR